MEASLTCFSVKIYLGRGCRPYIYDIRESCCNNLTAGIANNPYLFSLLDNHDFSFGELSTHLNVLILSATIRFVDEISRGSIESSS